MAISHRGQVLDPRVEVVALTEREWRVCDNARDAADGHRVIGYIEKIDDVYEALWLGADATCGASERYVTLAEAITALGDAWEQQARLQASGVLTTHPAARRRMSRGAVA